MTEKLTKQIIESWLSIEEPEFSLEMFRRKHDIAADSSVLYTTFTRLVDERELKRVGRGVYRKIAKIQPVKWWDGEDEDPLEFRFPRSYDDQTEFGIEDCVEVFAGDMVLITGDTNLGKTTIAMNIMAENLGHFPGTVLMGSEYTASNGQISPKFRRRMKRMNWVEWLNDNHPRFNLLPVGSDYEDYVVPDHLNVIDWISLPGEYYLIDMVMKSIKDRSGKGITVAVLQKNKGQEFAEGGQRSERYADVVLKIDPYSQLENMLTIGKVKAPKGKSTGRTWAFSIVDYGANLHNIREIVKCNKCWGKGYLRSGNNNIRCDKCNGLKFVDK